MGRFAARLGAAVILGISLLASQAGLASASTANSGAAGVTREITAQASKPKPTVGAQTGKPAPTIAPQKRSVAGPREGGEASIGRAIVPGFTSETFGANDDGSYPCIGQNAGTPPGCSPTPVALPFPVDFYGTTYESVYINNNGNLTFGAPLSDYTPESLNQIGVPMIAPFWADVDTRVGQVATFGYQSVGGHLALGVDYENVGCFSENDSVTNTFQVLLIDRSDLGAGDWQIEYNYGPLTWDSGQASGGNGQCLGGSAARAGYTSGFGRSCELSGSGVNGGLLDTNPITGLEYNDYGSSIPGRYVFSVSGQTGVPSGCGGYFAIGDSYSSGEGTDNYNYAGAPCDRGSGAWPSLLSAEYPAVPELSPNTFVACSGATSDEQAPQVAALKSWTNTNGAPALVTVTAGGDDLKFSNVLKTCVVGAFLGDSGASCVYILNKELNVLESNSFFTHMVNFYKSIAAAAGNTSNAAGGTSNVVVVGYPNLFPLPSLSHDVSAYLNCVWMQGIETVNLSAPVVLSAFANAQAELNDVLSGAAAVAGVRYVELGDLFAGHELCTGDPWINALRPFYSGAGHPNNNGQQAIAAYVASRLGYLPGEGTRHGGGPKSAEPKSESAGTKHADPAAKPESGPQTRFSAAANAAASIPPAARPAAGTPLTLDAGLVNGWVDEPYTGLLWGSGGTAPYTWTVTAGALPAGLSLDPDTGIITGTPTGAGTTAFTVTATDAGSPAETASEAVSITIASTAALSVTTTSLTAPTVGQAYSSTLAATGGVPVYAWSVSSGTLPAGLSLDPDTGTISGTPTTAGPGTFTIEASDSATPTADTATRTYTMTVTAATATLTLAAPTLPGATAGAAYIAPLPSTGGTAPLSWSVSTGALPPGLTLDPALGVISGVPTQSGTFAFGVSVSDAAAHTAAENLSITVAAGSAPSISTASLPGATAGSAYSQQLIGTGGVPDYSWSVSSGALPGGLSLDPSTGLISGTPATAGGYTFTIALTDSASPTAGTASRAYTITVAAGPAAPLFSLSDNSTNGVIGLPYQAALIPADGTSPYTFSVTAGTLPTGLTLDPSLGDISGTPTSAGTFTATITATDSSTPTAQTATDAITIIVTTPAALAITTTTVPDGAVGGGYATPVAATGGTGADTFTVSSGTLPAGLILDPASGVIYGVPTTAGAATFAVTVTDSATPTADTATQTLSLTIDGPAPVSVTTTDLPAATQGVAYSQILTASGGTQPYTWAVTSGTLPGGMTLDPSTGVLSGTPTGSGSSQITVTATDSTTPTAQTATASLTLTVYSSGTLSITTGTLAPDTASVGTAYSATLDAGGGTAPYAWSVSSGALPPGLSLDPGSGVISGTPTAGGAYPFTVTVTDSSTPTAQSASDSYTITVTAPVALSITTTSLPAGTVNDAYSAGLAASGGTAPYAWSVSSGALPAGLSLDPSTGAISGTPTATGTSDFTVAVTDSSATAETATADLSITIGTASLLPQTISFTAPSSGRYGGTTTLTATGGGSGNPVVFTIDAASEAGVCAVSGSNGTALKYTGVGSCVIDANQAGNARYAAAPQVQATVPVAKAAQSISFTAPTSGTVGRSVTLSATGGGSGNPVVFSVDASSGRGVCAVSGANGTTIAYSAAGSCVIDANQAGDADYAAAPQVQRTIPVSNSTATTTTMLRLSAASVPWGHERAVTFTITVAASHGTADGSVRVLAGIRLLCAATLAAGHATCKFPSATELAPGTHSVKANYRGSTGFTGSTSAAATLKVTKETAKPAVTLSAATITYGKEKSLIVTATVTAQYAGIPTGTVTITAGRMIICKGRTLAKGRATCSPASNTKLPAGSYRVVASYSGSADFAASTSGAKVLRVVKHGKAISIPATPATFVNSLLAYLRTW
jgi:hypothetical protein